MKYTNIYWFFWMNEYLLVKSKKIRDKYLLRINLKNHLTDIYHGCIRKYGPRLIIEHKMGQKFVRDKY